MSQKGVIDSLKHTQLIFQQVIFVHPPVVWITDDNRELQYRPRHSSMKSLFLTLDLMLLDFKYVETMSNEWCAFYFVKAYLAAICSTVLQNKSLEVIFKFLVTSASCYVEEFQTL